jgi:site-specific DNA-adenine methylase
MPLPPYLVQAGKISFTMLFAFDKEQQTKLASFLQEIYSFQKSSSSKCKFHILILILENLLIYIVNGQRSPKLRKLSSFASILLL